MMRKFPVLRSTQRERFYLPGFVRFAYLKHHEDQAKKNHNQTLERLADRGGLSPQELYAVAHDMAWDAVSIDEEGLHKFVTEIGYCPACDERPSRAAIRKGPEHERWCIRWHS
jgi:hypothetical protein